MYKIKRQKKLFKVLSLASLLVLTGVAVLLRGANAFPTGTGVLDSFNRANTASLSGQTTSAGQAWAATTINDSSATTLGILSNQLSRQGTSDNAYINTSYGPDSEAFTDVPVLPGNGEYVAFWTRIQNPGVNTFSAYALIYTHATSGNASWAISKVASGSFSNISTISAPALAVGDSLGLSVTGTGSSVTLTAYQKSGGVWSSIGSVNDTSGSRITSAGYIGLETNSNTVRLDNFGGGTIVNNTTPAAPQLSLPSNNATGVSTSPQFQFKSTDADGDNLQYKVEVCADAACSTVIRTIDQTASQTGWSGQDKAGSTAYAGATTLGASTLAVHNYQSPALADNTQYWWRAYAIDPSGTNAFSTASTIFSFTTSPAASGGNSSNSGSGNTSPSSSNSSSLDADLTPRSYATWGK